MNKQINEILQKRKEYALQKDEWKKYFLHVFLLCVILFVIFKIVIGTAIVEGHSMQPTYSEGNIVLFYKLAQNYDRGDIIVMDSEDDTYYIKRIIAVPGDEIEIDSRTNIVKINGEVLDESYIEGDTYVEDQERYICQLGEDQFFVMGDNREHSTDSRTFGVVEKDKLEGKVII
jgi:signal peptidase I